MDKLVDYTKYTLALAAGLLLYIPANFIPAHSEWERWPLIATVLMLVVSSVAGILLYTRATKLLLQPNPPASDGHIAFWGMLHQLLLVIAFVVAGYFFFVYKVWNPVPETSCTVSMTTSAGKPAELTFPCSG